MRRARHKTGKNSVPSNDEERKTILLYSPDMDFCRSMELYFQEQYTIVTTTDGDALPALAYVHHPELVIADTLPTERMRRRIDLLKHEHPTIRIMMFYVSRYDEQWVKGSPSQSVDAVFYKPIDLAEVTAQVDKLIHRN